MSAKVNAIPHPGGSESLPLMDDNIHFYDAFLSAPNKQEKLSQLERALFLFIEVLRKHELDPILKERKIDQVRELAKKVTNARQAALTGGKSQHVSRLQKQYQNAMKEYTGTTTQLQAFSEEFRKLWNAPPTSDQYVTIEGASSSPGLAPAEVQRQAKGSIATAASQTIRRIFSIALTKTLLTSRESRARLVDNQVNETEALEASANQDLQTFHKIIDTDPELRQSVEIEELERHSDDSDRRYYGPRPAMKPFEYPRRSTVEGEEAYNNEHYNRSTFIGQPAARTRPPGVMGHIHQLSDITEFRIVESELGHEDPGPSYFRQSTSAYAATPAGNQSGYQAGSSAASADQVSVSSLRTGSTESNYGDAWQSRYGASNNE